MPELVRYTPELHPDADPLAMQTLRNEQARERAKRGESTRQWQAKRAAAQVKPEGASESTAAVHA